MNTDDVFLLLLALCCWLAALAIFGWWAERKLERERREAQALWESRYLTRR